jgi:PAS domain S-box-containing protein
VTSIDLQRTFKALPGRFLLVRPDRDFTIAAVSDDFLRAAGEAGIVGRSLFEVIGNDRAGMQPADARNLRACLERVLASRVAQTLSCDQSGLPLPRNAGSGAEAHCRTFASSPVLADSGEVEYVVVRIEEGSAAASRDTAQAERERLIAESERQRRIYETVLDSTPDLIYVFDLDHRVIYANEALLNMWGVDDAYGQKLATLGYEQWHYEMHDREIEEVIATRKPIRNEVPFTGTNGRRIYDYIFAPVFGPEGDVVAIAGTTRDITERQAAEQALREHTERLAESDRAKDEFLATLSHELRNPLAPLRNSIALLRRSAGDAQAAPIHAMMERQVNHLVRLVDDLLEVSRLSRGTLSLRKQRIELAGVVRNAVETCEAALRAAGHRLTVDLPQERLWVDGDPVRLAQVLANLLDNAAKYTDSGGHIELRLGHDDGVATLRVIDDGAGIAADTLPRLFRMFSRGDRADRGTQDGLGIGLALSLRLVEMHDGTVEARSEGIGKGSEFIVRLPLAAAPEAAAAAAPRRDGDLARMRVLVVDDNHDARESMRMILGLLGADVQVAEGGAEALAILDDYDPAVVLLDIGMPGMDGYGVARAIRSRFAERAITLVALTGWGQEEDRRRAREAGFDHHLVKPADIDALQKLLRSFEAGERKATASG